MPNTPTVTMNGSVTTVSQAFDAIYYVGAQGTFVFEQQGYLAVGPYFNGPVVGGADIILNGGSILGDNRAYPETAFSATLTSSIKLASTTGINSIGVGTYATFTVSGEISDLSSSSGPTPLIVNEGLLFGGQLNLTNPGNSYAGGTVLAGTKLVLTARGAAGTGPIIADGAELDLLPGASANPNGTTTVFGIGDVAPIDQLLSTPYSGENVYLSDTSALVVGGRHRLLVSNGSAPSTVFGGKQGTTIFGGAGGGIFYGSPKGGNLIVAGTGAVTIGGGGTGDKIFAGSNGGDLIAAGSGNQTLGAAASSGDNILFAGSGSTLITTGAGHDIVIGNSGAETVVAGSGSPVVFAGSGSDVILGGAGQGVFQIGRGAASIIIGTGADIISAVNGSAGGYAYVAGFRQGIDHLTLRGYTADPALTMIGGSTTLTLADHTQIVLAGVPAIGPSAFA